MNQKRTANLCDVDGDSTIAKLLSGIKLIDVAEGINRLFGHPRRSKL